MHVQPPEGAPRSALSEHRSIPELMRSVVDGLTRLFRQEVALAKIEVTDVEASDYRLSELFP